MQIEIWYDYVCPFCHLGRIELQRGIAASEYGSDVAVALRSFELHPGFGASVPAHELVSKKLNITRDQALEMNNSLVERAAASNIRLNLDGARVVNTRDAHRLTQWARQSGKDLMLNERLFAAQFEDGADLADRETLVRLAGSVGLDERAAAAMLQGSDFDSSVAADIDRAQGIGVRGVPFFVIDGKSAVSGSVPAARWEMILASR